MKKSETRILHNFCATGELKKKHHIHTKTHANHNRNKITHLSELSVGIVCAGYSQFVNSDSPLLWVPANLSQQPSASSSALLLLLFAGWISCHVTKRKQAYQQQQQQVLLLLLLFFLSPSSSSSHNLELASNNYPTLCKQIKKQQQQRVREANCRSPGKDRRKPKNLDWPEVETWNPKKTLRKP